MDSVAKKALDNSLRWLTRSESSFQSGDYDIAIYELEMAGEVALKSLIMSKGFEIPKRHDVSTIIRSLVRNEKIVQDDRKDEFEGYLDSFEHVARVRGDAGYSYESSSDLEDFKLIYERHVEGSKKLVALIHEMFRT